MSRIIRSLVTTFVLISRIPVRTTTEPEYRHVAFFLPLVGIVPAFLVLLVCLGVAALLQDLFLAAVAAIVVQYVAFNLFHFDGLLDSADALPVFGDPERRLRILRDTAAGSFALFFGTIYLLLKVYLLFRGLETFLPLSGNLMPDLGLFLVLTAYPVTGRAAGAYIPVMLPPARDSGLGALLSEARLPGALLGTVVGLGLVSFPLLIGFSLDKALFLLSWIVAVPVTVAITTRLYRRRVGGYTGDTIGMAVELGELLHLLGFVVIGRFAS